MSTVTNIGSRTRKDNPATCLGRTYMVLRDASYWQDLEEIAESILARFDEEDSTGEIQRAVAELIMRGEMIETRFALGVGVSHREYLMLGEWPEGAA